MIISRLDMMGTFIPNRNTLVHNLFVFALAGLLDYLMNSPWSATFLFPVKTNSNKWMKQYFLSNE